MEYELVSVAAVWKRIGIGVTAIALSSRLLYVSIMSFYDDEWARQLGFRRYPYMAGGILGIIIGIMALLEPLLEG